MNKEKSREQYYVQIREPAELRRRILEASKSTIHGLQGYYEFMARREQKLKLVAQLKKELQEIVVLHAKLNAALPSFELPPEKPKLAPVSKKEKSHSKKSSKKQAKAAPKTPEKPRQKTELEKLNDMLSSVEQKLGRIQ